MLNRLRPAVIGAVIASVLCVGIAAADDGGGHRLLDARMTGIPVAGQTLLGIAGGGRTWVLRDGRATLRRDGRLNVEVEHLVLGPDAGAAAGTNPVRSGVAIVSCGGGATNVMSAPVPFDAGGNAEVEQRIILPSPCLAPVVFFAGVTGAGPRWFAVTGG